jgi:peptidyl-prolyl cis-trans isomerase A (cyclophilin A)
MKRFLAYAAMAASLTGAALAQDVTAQPQPAGAVITLHTTMGDIEVTLDPAGAPQTAAQFLGLVKSGHYDGAAVYRIEPGFVIQLGDLDAKLDYRAPPLPPIPLETATNKHSRGALSLAHADDPDSGQSTIFISLAENSGLDATPGAPPNTTGYAVFGRVTAGMGVVDAIAGVALAPESEGGPFPGKLPKEAVIVTQAVVVSEG